MLKQSELGGWEDVIQMQGMTEVWADLGAKVEAAYQTETVYPPRNMLFAAFRATPPESVKVVILGQDPYHEPNQACGLSFSVPFGEPLPRSLVNIYREAEADVGCGMPDQGCLEKWTEQGCLLLNTVLTVRAHEAGSHRKLGWEKFTDGVIRQTNRLQQPVVFMLWGAYAQKKEYLIQTSAPRLIIKSAHPSPLSAYRGFFGSRPFSRANHFLEEWGQAPIDWKL